MARVRKEDKGVPSPITIYDDKGGVLSQYPSELVATIKSTVAKGATDEELYMFLSIANQYNLNPFMKEIWFTKIPNRQTGTDEVAIMTSRDGYRKLAMRDKRFVKCHSAAVFENDEFETEFYMGDIENIKHKFTQKDRGKLVGAYAYLKTSDGEDLYAYMPIREYDKGNRIWKQYPSAMIRKIAENDVYKRFVNISGVNDFESMPNEFINDVAMEEAENSEELETIDVNVVDNNEDEPTCFTDLLGYEGEEKEAVENAKAQLAKEFGKL